MPEVIDEDEVKIAKSHIKGLKDDQKTDKFKKTQGFYGYIEGLEKPPKTKQGSENAKELRKLLEGIKSIKPFFRDKDPKLTPLVNYFYARYMAAWLRQSRIPHDALDITKDVVISGKSTPRDRFEKFCSLIENAYSIENETLDRIFPFDRVKTVGDKVGMLQQQYGLLRNEERKKFRTNSLKIKIPARQEKKDGNPLRFGHTVGFYHREYMKKENRLTNNERGMPQILNRIGDVVFLEVGAVLTSTGGNIADAESKDFENIEKWYFDGEDLNKVSEEDKDAFYAEPFDLMYMPTASDPKGTSHYLLDPYDEKVSVYLMDEEVFATKKNRYITNFELVASGETFIPPNPRDNKSFEALGDLVESLMAHIATVANDENAPGNEYDEIHQGLLGSKNLPGIAVYHANIFYHLLLAQARDPIANWRGIDDELLTQGRVIGIEAYLNKPLVTLCLWMLRNRNYVEFAGIDRNTNSPRIKSPERVSVAEAMVDERAKAEMTNSLSKLMIAYYRSMFSMLRSKPFLFPKYNTGEQNFDFSRQAQGEYNTRKKEKKDGMYVRDTDWVELDELWDDLLDDVENAPIDPVIMARIVDFMFADGSGRLIFPATMDAQSAEEGSGWNRDAMKKWIAFTFSAKPTDVGAYVECASAVSAAIRMTEYSQAETHHQGIERFLMSVFADNGYAFLIALLSLPESDALEEVRESLELKEGMTYMPKKNPKRTPKEAKTDEEYRVSIELDMPVEINLDNEVEVLALLDRIEDKVGDAGIDEPSGIGTDGRTIDMSWYIKGLENASDTLTQVTEIYSALGIPGRGWLEWGNERLSQKYTVDGYSYDDL